jgi:phenylacetate-coenzyme A ligase PaaK-like adenylate-forming protein
MKIQKVKQFQIIQKKLDELNILIVIDEDLRNTEPQIDVLFNKIKKTYIEKLGNTITIKVIEVKEIPSEKNKPAPLVISRLSQEEKEKIIDKSK